jgi:hypothetical protein
MPSLPGLFLKTRTLTGLSLSRSLADWRPLRARVLVKTPAQRSSGFTEPRLRSLWVSVSAPALKARQTSNAVSKAHLPSARMDASRGEGSRSPRRKTAPALRTRRNLNTGTAYAPPTWWDDPSRGLRRYHGVEERAVIDTNHRAQRTTRGLLMRCPGSGYHLQAGDTGRRT